MDEWEDFKNRILGHPETLNQIEGLLVSGGELFHQELVCGEDDPREVALTQNLARKMLENEALITAWGARAGEFLEQLAQRHGDKIENLMGVIDEHWDSEQLVETLEAYVGPDLQFIRINGTLFGGVIGLVIHGAELLIWWN